MKITAVIPVHDGKDAILACLERLAQSRLVGFNFSVIVVDGGGDGTAKAIAMSYPRVRVLQGGSNPSWSAAMNLGVAAALDGTCDFVLCLNDDILFDSQLLAGLAAEALAHPRSLVAPQAVADGGAELMQSGYDFIPGRGWTAAHKFRVLPTEPYEVQGLAGACVLIPAAAFRAVGDYASSELPQCHADVEFSSRARRAGFSCRVLPALRIKVRRDLDCPDLLHMPLAWESLSPCSTGPKAPTRPGPSLPFTGAAIQAALWPDWSMPRCFTSKLR